MRRSFTLLIILTLSTVTQVFGQITHPDLRIGTYGSYMDFSTFTELTLNSDHTFKYVDQSELSARFNYEGKWEVKRNKLVLYDSENNTARPMPTNWTIQLNEISSSKEFRSVGGKKYRITLINKSN